MSFLYAHAPNDENIGQGPGSLVLADLVNAHRRNGNYGIGELRKVPATDSRETPIYEKRLRGGPGAEVFRKMSLNTGSNYLLCKLLPFQLLGSILPKKQTEISDD